MSMDVLEYMWTLIRLNLIQLLVWMVDHRRAGQYKQ